MPGMKRRQLRGFDLKQIEGVNSLIGVDEVGRGAFAGPVVAAAVLVNREFLESRWALTKSGRVNDSKLLTPEQREELWGEFEKLTAAGLIHANHGSASVEEIAQLNILGATKLAMRRALEGIYPATAFQPERTEPDLFSSLEEREAYTPTVSARVLIDGLPLRSFPYPHRAFVHGDARSLCIAMASVIAKVTRDRLMVAMEAKHPGYGFAQHKGYGTEEHRDAVLRLGRCVEHREAFLRKLLAVRIDPAQMNLFEKGGAAKLAPVDTDPEVEGEGESAGGGTEPAASETKPVGADT
ncbi:ribonuclease HII [Opitutus sp. ER46]|nr:ribonuclease HII [Opitutus sp. ER46]